MRNENDEMRLASAEVQDKRRLVAFIYVLLRDKLTASDLEELLVSSGALITTEQSHKFTNGWLAKYAQYTVDRISEVN